MNSMVRGSAHGFCIFFETDLPKAHTSSHPFYLAFRNLGVSKYVAVSFLSSEKAEKNNEISKKSTLQVKMEAPDGYAISISGRHAGRGTFLNSLKFLEFTNVL